MNHAQPATRVTAQPLQRLASWPHGWPSRVEHRIVRAAVVIGEVVYTGWRHSEIGSHVARTLGVAITDEQRGFIDHLGNFHDRRSAAKIALGSRQVLSVRAMTLLSEDLWDENGVPHRGADATA
jgi:hypothetical protein